MKKKETCLWIVLLVVFFSWMACNSNEKSTGIHTATDIPATTKSDKAKLAFKQALAFYDDGNLQKAHALFNKAIDEDSNLAIAYLYRANLYLSPKDFANDLAKAKTKLEGASEWEKLYYDFQNTFVTDDWNKRLEIAQKITAAYPAAARAQVDLGKTYQAGNQTDKEREAYQKAIELDPKWIPGYHALGVSYLVSDPKDLKKAKEYALKVVEMAPKSPSAEISLGDCYRGEDSLEKAGAAYTKAIKLDPDHPEPYYKRGHIYSFLGKYGEARDDYMEGAKIDESNLGPVFIANSYLYAGDPDAALQSLLDAIEKANAFNASKSKVARDQLSYLYACALICFHHSDAVKLKEIITMMQGPSNQVAADVGSEQEKLVQDANLIYWKLLTDLVELKLDSAREKAEQIKVMLEPVRTPIKLQDYEMALGLISMIEKKYTNAIAHFEQANLYSCYTKYCLAMANEAAGNKEKATELFKEVSIYNFNETGYALVRNEVRKKLAMIPSSRQ